MAKQKIKIETPNQAARAVKTAKFEITITVEAEVVNGQHESAASISNAAIKGIEYLSGSSLSSPLNGKVSVEKIHVSQLTFPKSLATRMAELQKLLKES